MGIGVLQAFALLPGVSRSGATIAGGIQAGLDRESAGTFAFLLAIPAIAGAGAIEVWQLLGVSDPAGQTAPATLFAGAAIAMLVGWFALWWLVRWIRAGRLSVFAWYLFPLGAIVIAWQLTLR